jgi:hypothetical protein
MQVFLAVCYPTYWPYNLRYCPTKFFLRPFCTSIFLSFLSVHVQQQRTQILLVTPRAINTNIGKCLVFNWNIPTVPDGIWENAWILEYRELAREKVLVWGVSYPNQALPALSSQKSSSRDPAAMEEMYAKSTPYSFETLHSRVQWPTE